MDERRWSKRESSQFLLKAIHDELQAYQLAYTQLESRYKDLETKNEVLRREITEKMEKKCSELDKEVEQHQQWDSIDVDHRGILFLFFFIPRRMEEDVKRKLDEARNDVTSASMNNIP